MPGSLVLIQETTVSSAVASVTLTGINSTYDVYKVVMNNLKVSADDVPIMRVTKSGTAQSDSEYDFAYSYLKSDAVFADLSNTNQTKVDCMATIESSVSGGNGNGVYYLFNFPNASEYSFITIEEAHFQQNENSVRGFQGGFVHTVASASDGVFIALDSGNNYTAGTFKLYGIKK
jgi:hypothetical protein